MRRFPIIFALLVGLLSDPAWADKAVNKSSANLAIKGYDVVAYFVDSKPVRGNAQFSHSWNSATWQFASAANRDLFAKDPEKYAPQYGGYCAYAMAKNSVVDIDPDALRIVDGKLYLNYSQSVQRQFLAEIPGLIKSANQNWPAHRARLTKE
jgi:YHS domain-containing protein